MPKSYFKLSQEEVDSLVEADIFGLPTSVGLGVYEIGCGGKSTVKFAQMLKIGVIDSYEGDNIEQGMVDEAKARGLKAKLVGRNYDHSGDFKALKERFGDRGVVAMYGLSEVAPEAARHYKEQAKSLDLRVIDYPKI